MTYLAPMARSQEAVVEMQERERRRERDNITIPEQRLRFGVDGVAGGEKGEAEAKGLGIGRSRLGFRLGEAPGVRLRSFGQRGEIVEQEYGAAAARYAYLPLVSGPNIQNRITDHVAPDPSAELRGQSLEQWGPWLSFRGRLQGQRGLRNIEPMGGE